jgi:hypothetical protein
MYRVLCLGAYLNAYKAIQIYGGPEEGGWWYTLYEPVASLPHTLVYGALVLTLGHDEEPSPADPFRDNGFLDRPDDDSLTPVFAVELDEHENHMWEALREYGESNDDIILRWETGFAHVSPTPTPHYD